MKMNKENKTNYPDFEQKKIANTFKLKTNNNLLKNKQNMLKRQTYIYGLKNIFQIIQKKILIFQKKKFPKYKIQNVESFKFKSLSLLIQLKK